MIAIPFFARLSFNIRIMISNNFVQSSPEHWILLVRSIDSRHNLWCSFHLSWHFQCASKNTFRKYCNELRLLQLSLLCALSLHFIQLYLDWWCLAHPFQVRLKMSRVRLFYTVSFFFKRKQTETVDSSIMAIDFFENSLRHFPHETIETKTSFW